MTGSIALDVVIGLVFVYLLYSLLATLITEIIATHLALRAKNLKEAINRMINDEGIPTFRDKVIGFFNIPVNPKNPIIQKFYNHQEIKYLGQTNSRKPSAIKAESFTKVILDYIKSEGNGATSLEKIRSGLQNLIAETEPSHVPILGKETAAYVQSILEDCQNDLDRFRSRLSEWFDRTMEQTTEWYKKRVQIILFFVGFLIAWFFNADTFTIVKKLSFDKDARDQMVELAGAYIENNDYEKIRLVHADTMTSMIDSAELAQYRLLVSDYNKRLDDLLDVKEQLDRDLSGAHSVLGLGSWLPNEIRTDSLGRPIYPEWVEPDLAGRVVHACQSRPNETISISAGQKFHYLVRLFFLHFWGYLITALAISLGAPFWFDLLNKLMQLRGTISKKGKAIEKVGNKAAVK